MKVIKSVSIQVSKSTDESTGIDLQLLGVPADWSSLQPTATRFPQSFSKESNAIWVKMFTNQDCVVKIRNAESVQDKWKVALRCFLDICDSKGVAPFSSLRNRVDNSSLISFLKTSRLRLAKFMDETKLLETLRIIRGSQDRKYETGMARFVVRSSAMVKSPFTSIEDLAKYLNGHRFVREPNNTFKRIVTTNLTVFITAPSVNRVKVSYQIVGCQSVFMGNKYRTPTKKQVHQFCETMVYLPLIRAHRIKALGTHTLF